MRGAVNRYRKFPQQSGVTADVVVMVMGVEYGDELQIFASQKIQHRRSIARINHGGVAAVVDDPDIIVSKCADRNNM